MKMRWGFQPQHVGLKATSFFFLHLEGDKCLDPRIGSNCRDHVTLDLSPVARANPMERERETCLQRKGNYLIFM